MTRQQETGKATNPLIALEAANEPEIEEEEEIANGIVTKPMGANVVPEVGKEERGEYVFKRKSKYRFASHHLKYTLLHHR